MMETLPKTINLENGLRIILEYRDYSRICSSKIFVAAGSYFETAETSGYSHFIEHMIFKGTKNRSCIEIAEETDRIGGLNNAYTSKSNTCYYITSLSEHSKDALDILCDMTTNPLFLEEDIQNEKGVVEDEYNMCEDLPEDVCVDAYDEYTWRGSSLSQKVLGTLENIRSVDRSKLLAHYTKYYVPERTVISICGKFDENEMLDTIKKYYGPLPSSGFPVEFHRCDFNSGINTLSRDFNQNQLCIGFPAYNYDNPGIYAQHIMGTILAGSSSSRMFQILREQSGLIYSVECEHMSIGSNAEFCIDIGFSPENEEKVLSCCFDIINGFAESLTEDELSRAVEQEIAATVMELEGASSVAQRNGYNLIMKNTVYPIGKAIDAYRKLTLEELAKASREILNLSNVSVCIAGKTKDKSIYKAILEDRNGK